jgi:predicted nucleic acid-binding protein
VTICIVDTSAFCNVLDIPGKNQDRDKARAELRSFIDDNTRLLLPLAAVSETGRHIAQLGDGHQRRSTAEGFVKQVLLALNSEAPWAPTPLPAPADLTDWLAEFPDAATRGLSLADLSIIKLWHQQCELHRGHRVMIWTYDNTDLGGYDRPAKVAPRQFRR